MKRFVILSTLMPVVLLAGCADCCGCGEGPGVQKAEAVVDRSLDVTGGKDAWKSIAALEGSMLLKVFGKGEAPYVTRVQFTMHLDAGKIDASALTGDGKWTASVNTLGEGSFSIDGVLGEAVTEAALKEALGQVAHRFRGAGNIAWADEKPYGLTEDRIDGIAVDCVAVRWTENRMRRYCFEKDSGRLRFAVAGANRAGMEGTITIYSDYTKQANGMVLPMDLRQVEIGEYVLLGDTPKWDAQLLSVTMR